jgi:hypothetical protein
MNKENTNSDLPSSLLICVTFHYVTARLIYLEKISKHFPSLGEKVTVCIITNTSNPSELNEIDHVMKKSCGYDYSIIIAEYLGHPYLLTWVHLGVFRKLYPQDIYSHFLYTEDDICITKENVMYWIRSRLILRPYGLIPSFIRYEFKDLQTEKYATDFVKFVNYYAMPRLRYDKKYVYLNMSNAYQGVYFMDKALMREHLYGESSNPDFGQWDIRARAAAGVTFLDVPNGFLSRNVVGFVLPEMEIDENALIHHVPNNYTNNNNTRFGKILISQLVKKGFLCYLKSLLIKLKRFRKKIIKNI